MPQSKRKHIHRSRAEWSRLLAEYEAGDTTQRDFCADGRDKVPLDWIGLKLMLEGISLGSTRKYKRYRHSRQSR